MPKIPTAIDAGIGFKNSNSVSVNQNIQTSQSQFGGKSGDLGKLGNSLINVSSVLSRNAARMREQEDQNASINAASGSSQDINVLLNDPEKGAFSQKGKNAVGLYDNTIKTLDEIENKYANDLRNENQKLKFRAFFGQKKQSVLNAISRHEARERRVYNEQSEEAFLQTTIENVSLNYNDINQIRVGLNQVEELTLANRNGEPESVVSLRLQKRKTAIHQAVLSKMSVASPSDAIAYYEANQKDILESEKPKVLKSIKHGAEENYYGLLNSDPAIAIKSLENNIYSRIFSNKEINQLKKDATDYVNNLGKRAEANALLQRMGEENNLFQEIISSNREDALQKIYEYQNSRNGDPLLINGLRKTLLRLNPPSQEEKDNAVVDLETTLQSFEIEKVRNRDEYTFKGDVTLRNVLDFNRNIELNRLAGNISDSLADKYKKRAAPLLIELAKNERGYDDKGEINSIFGLGKVQGEDYDDGTEAISNYLKRNNQEDNIPLRVKMFSEFIETWDKVSDEIKNDPIERDKKLDEIVEFVKSKSVKQLHPEFRGMSDIPNKSLSGDGTLQQFKDTESNLKSQNKINSSGKLIAITGDKFLKIEGEKAKIVNSKGEILEDNLIIDNQGNVTRAK